jgi:hypothetical protein
VKNLFAAFENRLLPYLFAFAWLAVMFWEPLIILGLLFLRRAPEAQTSALVACAGLSFLLWLISFIDMRLPFGLASLYPLIILANELAAFESLRKSLFGGIVWKDREVPRSHWRWF